MKKKLISLLIVVCMVFAMFPVSAFAAESYGIYVGGTEVTTANYKNITGKGISGKVSYDPESGYLTLENATITSYIDADPSIGDQYGILADGLSIKLIGNNTIKPANSGQKSEYCVGIGSSGDIYFSNLSTGSLSVIAENATNNIAILSVSDIMFSGGKVYAEAGKTDNGISYGISSADFNAFQNASVTAVGGSSTTGESIGIFISGRAEIAGNASITAKGGNAPFSCGYYGESVLFMGDSNPAETVNLTAFGGTTTEYDSVGFYCNSVMMDNGTIKAYGGTSQNGGSIGFSCKSFLGGFSGINSNISGYGGSSPNGSSIGILSENAGGFSNGNVIGIGGSGQYSCGICFNNGGANFNTNVNITAIGGESTIGDSDGLYINGKLVVYENAVLTIKGGSAPNGTSTGLWTDTPIEVQTSTSRITITGKDQAVSMTPDFSANSYCWAGFSDPETKIREFHDGTQEPLTDAEQYTYLHIRDLEYFPVTPFDDIYAEDYYAAPVSWAVDNGITYGTDLLTFSPDDTCTRAQTVTFLWRNAGSPQPESTEMPFTDVEADDYFYNAVLWAVENNITVGTSDTTFSPDDTVTRAQVVTFMWRQIGEPGMEQENPFTDVADTEYYYNAVLWAVENGITVGTGEGVFSPDDGCTRGQIVTFLHRYFLSKHLHATYADETTLDEGEYHFCKLSDSEYAVNIMITTNITLSDIVITSLELSDEGYKATDVLFELTELTSEKPLILAAEFPGDFTAYGITYTDENYVNHHYSISISGRDGSVLITDIGTSRRCPQCHEDEPAIHFSAENEICDHCMLEILWSYTETDEGIIVTGFAEYIDGDEFTIPNMINNKPVIGVAEGNWTLGTSLILPETLKYIGKDSFIYTKYTSITLPEGLARIERNAFYDSELKEVVIPDSVVELGKGVFWYGNLTSVTLSNSITTIPEHAFSGCQFSSITIPASVTTIESQAFSDCLMLKEVYILSDEIDIPINIFFTLNSDFQPPTIYAPMSVIEEYAELTDSGYFSEDLNAWFVEWYPE